MSNNPNPVVVTVEQPAQQIVTYSDDQHISIDVCAPSQISVEVFETGQKGDKGDTGAKGEKGDTGDAGVDGINGTNGTDGKDGITHAITTINVDSSRPIAYWGYRLASDNTEHIAKLDYTNGQMPVVKKADVSSVESQWAQRTTLNYL